ncbi:MAG: phosphoribosyltransferase [Bdellovibrio sp.]|nr:phosphoribosyltransferase [Bdellovibrio sp.]
MFQDRSHAGQALAKEFKNKFITLQNPLIIALPRGGIPVAFEIAKAFNISMDIIAVKKIGAPFDEELALGAITESGDVFLNENILSYYELEKEEQNRLCEQAKELAIARGKKLREGKPHISLSNKSVILVDDGIATGATFRAALKYLRRHKVLKVVVAVPVCAEEAWDWLKGSVDEFFVLDMPSPFISVGRHYISFPQVTDDEAITLLRNSRSLKNKSTSNNDLSRP